MAFVKVCTVDELGSSGIASFYINGVEVLVVRDRYEKLHAFYGLCPHEDFPLADGHFDGATITCAVHGWIIDATTGRGISPPSCRISAYPLRLEGNEIHVDLDTELP
jgi:toluene monooxygenase system ferredoxin subunit